MKTIFSNVLSTAMLALQVVVVVLILTASFHNTWAAHHSSPAPAQSTPMQNSLKTQRPNILPPPLGAQLFHDPFASSTAILASAMPLRGTKLSLTRLPALLKNPVILMAAATTALLSSAWLQQRSSHHRSSTLALLQPPQEHQFSLFPAPDHTARKLQSSSPQPAPMLPPIDHKKEDDTQPTHSTHSYATPTSPLQSFSPARAEAPTNSTQLTELYSILPYLKHRELTALLRPIRHHPTKRKLLSSADLHFTGPSTIRLFAETLQHREFHNPELRTLDPAILEHLFLALTLGLNPSTTITEILSEHAALSSYSHAATEAAWAATQHILPIMLHDFITGLRLLEGDLILGKKASLKNLKQAFEVLSSTLSILSRGTYAAAPSLPSLTELAIYHEILESLELPETTYEMHKKLKVRLHLDHPELFFQHVFLARVIGLQSISRRSLEKRYHLPHTSFLIPSIEKHLQKKIKKLTSKYHHRH